MHGSLSWHGTKVVSFTAKCQFPLLQAITIVVLSPLANFGFGAEAVNETLIPTRTMPLQTYASQAQIDEYIQILGHINGAAIAESAGSHGSYGTFVGVGIQRTTLNEPSILLDENLNSTPQATQPTTSMTIPRVYITRGLPIPVDLTLGAANISSKVNQLQLTLQATLFQSFNWPSLAMRGTYGQLFGIPQTDFSTGSGSLVASYSLLNYFTFFYEIILAQHWVNIRPYQPNAYTYLLLTDNEGPAGLSVTHQEKREALGIQVALYTFPLSLTLQWERDSYQQINQTAKLTVMF